ncbi:MAG: hypothetical protein P8Q90_05680, partial [Candidatus Thalassarchaeaceae archaeon]|nr:hypothetical protein [Candidatus Thalassarchaeaceae archaeon]
MRRALTPLFLVLLMVTMPWSSSSFTTHEVSEESPLWTASEAAENWYESNGAPGPGVSISSGSGQLWVQTGNFDPLHQQSIIPPYLQATDDPFATGFLIIQLFENNGGVAEILAKGVDANIVDTLPEDAWVLRLPYTTEARSAAIIQLAEDDRVRWVGAQQPAWRLDIDLHQSIGMIDLDLTLAQDVDTSQMEEHLYMAGSEFVRCDDYLCQAIGIDS